MQPYILNMKYVLFDLDGTLTDPHEGITKSVQYALDYYGIHVENLNELDCFIGPPLIESFEKYYGFSHIKAVEAVNKYRERFAPIGLFENIVYEGIEKLLSNLKLNGYKLYVATSKPEVFSVRILEKFNLIQYFDIVVGSMLDGTRVNKSDVIDEVFNRAHILDKENAIMVGDRLHDILGAKKSGIKSIGVEYGYAEKDELKNAKADYVVKTVDELNKLLISIK